MEIRPDEIMHNYFTIVEAQDAAAPPPIEVPWHGTIELDTVNKDLEINATPMFLEQVLISNAEEDLSTLKEKRHPVKKEDMIERAHPKPVYVSNALGDGGLVENQNEQQAKIIEIINKMPSGSHINLYAEAIIGLQKVAYDMENDGLVEESVLIDATLSDLVAELKKKVITKEAFPIMTSLVGLGIIAGGGALLSGILGIQENLVTDANDLLSNIRGWMNDTEYQAHRSVIQDTYRRATSVQSLSRRLLSATSQAAMSSDPSSGKKVALLAAEIAKLLSVLSSNIDLLASIYPGITGLDFQRTKGLIRDVNGGLAGLGNLVSNVAKTRNRSSVVNDVNKALEKQKNISPQPTTNILPSPEKEPAGQDRIKEIQDILSKHPTVTFGNKTYTIIKNEFPIDGKLNIGTKEALHNLASAVRRRFGQVRNLPGSRLYNASPAQIRDLLDFAEEPWSRMSGFKLSKEVYPQN